MPDKKRSAKLSVEQKVKVLSLIAYGYGSQRIVDYLEDNYGVMVSRQNIQSNYINNAHYKGRIERIRRIIDNNAAQHPLASKAVRLNILLEAINMTLAMKKNISCIADLIAAARKEFEENEKEAQDFEQYYINFVKKYNENNKVQLTRTEHTALDKFMAK